MNDADERQARLAALRSNLAAATPGPWEFDSYCRVLAPMAHLDDAEHYGNIVAWVPAWHGDTACKPHDDNAELIANAPADLAWLLAEVERLEAERAFFERNAHKATALAVEEYDRANAIEAERAAATARAERAAALCARFEALTTDLAKALPMSIKSELTVEHLRRLQDEGVSLMTERAALAEQGEAG